MVYCYALCEQRADPIVAQGLRDRPLRGVDAAGLTAIVSDLDDPPPVADEHTLWSHERVVEELMGHRALLPMRFGSVLADDQAVAELLRGRAPEFRAALDRVAGAIELGVRAAWRDQTRAQPSRDDDASGTSYLLGLRNQRRRADELAERIDAPLRALSRDGHRRVMVTPALALSGAYLVDHVRAQAFRDRVAALDQEIVEADILCTGPWPPYSFVGPEPRVAP